MKAHAPPRARTLGLVLAAVSLALLAARAFASTRLGFGDGEALYAVYGLHPAPAYVDHPGLIGAIASTLAGGTDHAVSAARAHAFTSVVATLVPLVMCAAARLAGAPPRRALLLGLLTALVPELAIGLFGLTPDLPFAVFFPLTAGLVTFACRATRRAGSGDDDHDRDRDLFLGRLALVLAGACAGLATVAKAPGLVLIPWLAVTAWRVGKLPRWLVVAATLLALLIVSPVVAFEVANGAPMLVHRLVRTQQSAGFSLRNIGALVGGQLAYASPPVALAAAWVAIRLVRQQLDGSNTVARRDPIASSLLALTLATGVPLAILCSWSRVAEPHWFAPTLLPLGLCWARRPPEMGRWRAAWPGLQRSILPVATALVGLVHLYVLTDLFPRLMGDAYEGRYDLANDMMMYPSAGVPLREAALLAKLAAPRRVEATAALPFVVVAPHWTIAAQVATELPGHPPITTATAPDAPDDDFQRWVTPAVRDDAQLVVFVTDDRFDARIPAPLSLRPLLRRTEQTLHRGGRAVRTVTITVLGPAPSSGLAAAP